MLQMVGRKFKQTILLVLVAISISMVSANQIEQTKPKVYREKQIVNLVEHMFYYDELDVYPESGSLDMKDLFVEFVKKYHKKYFSPEEIRLRYELFKLRVIRDGHYDATTDMTTKEQDAMKGGHDYDGGHAHDYDGGHDRDGGHAHDYDGGHDHDYDGGHAQDNDGGHDRDGGHARYYDGGHNRDGGLDHDNDGGHDHDNDDPRDYDYDNEYGEENDKERSDNKDKNSSVDPYQTNSITKKPFVGGNKINTGQKTTQKSQEVQIETEPNNIKVISAKEPIQMIFNNCTVIIKNPEDLSSNMGLTNNNSLGKDELRNETESLNHQPTKKANNSIGQTSENSNYLENITKPTQDSITSTDINLISNEDKELNSSHPTESIQDSTQTTIIIESTKEKIDDLTTLEQQNQTNDPYFGKTFQKLVPDYNTTISADNKTEDEQTIRYRSFEGLFDKQVNYRSASGVTTEGVIKEDKETQTDNEDNETDNRNEYDDISEIRLKTQDKSLVKNNSLIRNLLPQYSNKKIINSKYPKFYNIYNINSSVVQI